MNKWLSLSSLPKRSLRCLVDAALLLRNTKLPRYFHLRDRLAFLIHGLEPSVVSVTSSILYPGDTAVDIGANVGYLTRVFATRVGSEGRVFAFEPDPTTFECLCYNTRRFSQIDVSGTALSDRSGEMTFYLHPTSGMSNSLVNAWPEARRLTVPTVTFDAWAASRSLKQVRLIKIDVEGAEVHVLRGMQHSLTMLDQLSIIVEFCPKNLGAEAAEHEMFELLRRHGYFIDVITSSGGIHRVRQPQDVYQHLNASDYANLLVRR